MLSAQQFPYGRLERLSKSYEIIKNGNQKSNRAGLWESEEAPEGISEEEKPRAEAGRF
jgi:hypothetical protein